MLRSILLVPNHSSLWTKGISAIMIKKATQGHMESRSNPATNTQGPRAYPCSFTFFFFFFKSLPLQYTYETKRLYLNSQNSVFYTQLSHTSYHLHFHQTLGVCLKCWLPWSSAETWILQLHNPGRNSHLHSKEVWKP